MVPKPNEAEVLQLKSHLRAVEEVSAILYSERKAHGSFSL